MQKRLKYESFLEQVPLLQGLSSYERATVADSFAEATVGAGAQILKAGAEGNDMFFLVSGTAEALDPLDESVVHTYDTPGACAPAACVCRRLGLDRARVVGRRPAAARGRDEGRRRRARRGMRAASGHPRPPAHPRQSDPLQFHTHTHTHATNPPDLKKMKTNQTNKQNNNMVSKQAPTLASSRCSTTSRARRPSAPPRRASSSRSTVRPSSGARRAAFCTPRARACACERALIYACAAPHCARCRALPPLMP